MIDLAAITGLFPAALQASKEWTEPKIARIGLGTEVNEPAFLALKEKGHAFHWCRNELMRERAREGWLPVVERDRVARPTIFADPPGDMILMHRPPTTE